MVLDKLIEKQRGRLISIRSGGIMKNKKFICRQAAALMLSAAMVSTYVLPAAAEVPETRKEENIYANLSKDGEVEGIYVVNGYELSRKTDIVDYGDYTAVRNLTSSSEIRNQDGRIETSADQGKFYYQGNLAHNDLPWLIGIDYELNGKKYLRMHSRVKAGQ